MRELVRLSEAGAVCHADAPLFRDIADQLGRVASLTTGPRIELDSAFEHSLSAVANSQNEIMKSLLPLTVIVGIYGMSFVHMPEIDERWGYPAVLALNVVIVIGGLAYFRPRGWIGRQRELPDHGCGLEIASLGRMLRLPTLGSRALQSGTGASPLNRGRTVNHIGGKNHPLNR